jgi:hypothetical protein
MKTNTQPINRVNNIFSIFAIVILLVALVNFGVTYVKYNNMKRQITGYASGYVNVTISAFSYLNLSRDTINFGTGSFNATGNQNNVTMFTNQDNVANISDGGNWSNAARAIVLQNLGTTNFSISVASDKTSDTFFGGTTAVATFMLNYTNKDANACVQANTSFPLNGWINVTNTSAMGMCNRFTYLTGPSQREMYIDAKVIIPRDASNGTKAATLTISANTQTA